MKIRETKGLDISLTSGIWGGTYLIANDKGVAKNRIQRLYCIVNMPRDEGLEDKENRNIFMELYGKTCAEGFEQCGLTLVLEQWGAILPYSNRNQSSLIMHLSDTNKRVRWLRLFFVWNVVPWEESMIHDAVRNIKVLKELLDLNVRPLPKDSEELKFLMQDVIIVYRTLENALHPDFVEHAQPIIDELTGHYMKGLNDPELIWNLYMKVYSNALVYGLEEALAKPYARAGLDIHKSIDWPIEKINWVPEELKEKLIPPIKSLFDKFRTNLESDAT
tara:strand:- start:191 stop:1018 length:828 start_codon:yes stop_codon:yes gene_type:complete